MQNNGELVSARSHASALSGRVHPKHDLTSEVEKQLRECFSIFDTSGDGSIDAEELNSILEAMNHGKAVTIDDA